MHNGEADRTKIIVGLGNPGRRYANTRHNLGFAVADVLVDRWQAGQGKKAFGGQFYHARLQRGPKQRLAMLLKPLTYMNRSGRAVREMSAFYKADPDQILVVLDDLALPTGRLRARVGGSAGGHNGLADVLEALGRTQTPRLRIGIGQAPPNMDSTDFVLRPFEADEREIIETAVQQAADAVEDWVFNGIEFVMDKYNGN